MDKDKTIQELIHKVNNLVGRVQQLEVFEKENKILRKENTILKAENAELKNRLNRNSKNSSQPPSSDGYKSQRSPKRKKASKVVRKDIKDEPYIKLRILTK